MKLFLIRHGSSVLNDEKRWAGQTDTPLSARGKSELTRLKSEYEYPSCEYIFSSPLTRCIQSCEIIYGRKPDFFIEKLSECNFGSLEGTKYTNFTTDAAYISWIKNPDVRVPNGESLNEFIKRALEGYFEMLEIAFGQKYKRVTLIVHGDIIRAILHRFANDTKQYDMWEVPNGCVYETEVLQNGKISDWKRMI